MPASSSIKALGGYLPPPLLRRLRHTRDAWLRSRITAILSRPDPPNTSRATADFTKLQAEFNGVPEYGFDAYSIWKRGAERALKIASLPSDKNKKCRVLEVGCGDAMTGFLLSLQGHDVVVSDMDDWRDRRAKSLEFCRCILEKGLPHEDASFDVIFSYNAFEHFADPAKCFAELTRLIKPGGIIHLDYGPLYASAWGLHASSSLMMPFPQFLFSEPFIREQLTHTGVYDLGKQSDSLQPLNKWLPRQFRNLWSNPRWQILTSDFWGPNDFLPVIQRYPECFSGRGLTFEDVKVQGIVVTLRRQSL